LRLEAYGLFTRNSNFGVTPYGRNSLKISSRTTKIERFQILPYDVGRQRHSQVL
jgi:hypothetical protein